jgi:hypothetical protein
MVGRRTRNLVIRERPTLCAKGANPLRSRLSKRAWQRLPQQLRYALPAARYTDTEFPTEIASFGRAAPDAAREKSNGQSRLQTVMHLDPAPEKGGIAGHTDSSLGFRRSSFNSTKVLG